MNFFLNKWKATLEFTAKASLLKCFSLQAKSFVQLDKPFA